MLLRSGRNLKRFTAEQSSFLEKDISSSGRNLIGMPVHQDICPICLDDIAKPVQLSCRHIYCMECIFRLQRHEGRGAKCPICRRKISSSVNIFITCFSIAAAAVIGLMLCFVCILIRIVLIEIEIY